jgi:hypothetical protein
MDTLRTRLEHAIAEMRRHEIDLRGDGMLNHANTYEHCASLAAAALEETPADEPPAQGEAWKCEVYDRIRQQAQELGFAGMADALDYIAAARATPPEGFISAGGLKILQHPDWSGAEIKRTQHDEFQIPVYVTPPPAPNPDNIAVHCQQAGCQFLNPLPAPQLLSPNSSVWTSLEIILAAGQLLQDKDPLMAADIIGHVQQIVDTLEPLTTSPSTSEQGEKDWKAIAENTARECEKTRADHARVIAEMKKKTADLATGYIDSCARATEAESELATLKESDLDALREPTPWKPVRHFGLWKLERRLWSNWAGSTYEIWYRYPISGFIRRFWTRAQAEAFAKTLNENKA